MNSTCGPVQILTVLCVQKVTRRCRMFLEMGRWGPLPLANLRKVQRKLGLGLDLMCAVCDEWDARGEMGLSAAKGFVKQVISGCLIGARAL